VISLNHPVDDSSESYEGYILPGFSNEKTPTLFFVSPEQINFG
jgi:hypothetical protein